MSDVQPLFIGGTWRDGSEGVTGDVVDPAIGQRVRRVAHASADDVAAAIRSAADAWTLWRETTPDRRAAILARAADLIVDRTETIATDLTREQGKTLAESRAELARVIETLRWHAEEARSVVETTAQPRHARREPGETTAPPPAQRQPTTKQEAGIATMGAGEVSHAERGAGSHAHGASGVVRPEPLGVVGAFIPWNYPAVIAARKVAAALVAGCTVVLKGAEETPTAVAAIVQAVVDAGLPPGVVNLLFGDPAAISAQVLNSPVVQAFSFTGSTAVGKQLAQRAAQTLKRCVLELGGHAPVLVFADADLDAAIRDIAAYKFECAGQSCNAPSRIYVEASIYDRFVDRFTAAACALRVGPGLDPSTDMGPMANPRRLAAMARLTEDARARGASVIAGGARLVAPRSAERRLVDVDRNSAREHSPVYGAPVEAPAGRGFDAAGYFWPPTILVDVPDTAAMMIEEPFGPLVPIAPFATYDEAIARANATPYGLAAYVFTQSAAVAAAATRALAAGSVGVNALQGVPPDVAIAGIKDSGYGYEGGRRGIEAFQNLKVVRGQPVLLL